MKRYSLSNYTFLIISFIAFQQAYTQNFERRIDSMVISIFQDNKAPGGVLLVSHKGKPIYRKAFGKANVELNVDMNAENIFQIGSMTKQFTALSILQLQEQGKLGVMDAVSKYLPNYPNGDKIKIHHLLTHTSGIKDFTKMRSIMSIAKNDISPKELVDFFKDQPVDFQPGEKFDYNNSGYVLLGYLIELISGVGYEEYVQKNIFNKLKMNNSRYSNDRAIIKNRAYGYHKRGVLTNKIYISLSIPYASGSLMSNVDDLLKWQEAIKNNHLLSPQTTKQLFTNYKLNSGRKINYGYGWHLKDLNSLPTYEHGGSIFGFKSMGVYVPSLDLYVVGLSNCDCNSPTRVVRNIASTMINEFRKQ